MSATAFWIGTSWKMNKTLAEATAFACALRDADAARAPHIQRFVIPPFTAIRDVSQILAESSVQTGVQNMHWDDHGPWTGEISAPMVKDCGAQIVELGHSERRTHFGETDDTVGRKVQAALRHGLTPLICIGETLAEREAGQAQQVLERQTRTALQEVRGRYDSAQILLAYEPVWAIGAQGIPASPDYANAQQALITETARAVLGRKIPCLYGGSVTLDNCDALLAHPHIDGLFIGRAAWDVQGYLNILARCAAVTNGEIA